MESSAKTYDCDSESPDYTERERERILFSLIISFSFISRLISSSKAVLEKSPSTAELSNKLAMAKCGKSSIVGVNEFQRYVCSVVPALDYGSHKGQCGRIGIVGGSDVFVGESLMMIMM